SALSYVPGSDFKFDGRVHTNGYLFLAAGAAKNLWFTGPVRAVNDVVRDTLAKGRAVTASGHTGAVYLPTGTGGCDAFVPGNAAPATCRALSYNNPDEGSSINGTQQPPGIPTAGGAANANWSSLSRSVYNGMVLNGLTGASPLHLPFVKDPPLPPPAPQPIEIIRRPQPADTAALAQSRLYSTAQVRVLLSDDPSELPAGPGTIRLAETGPYSSGASVPGPPGNDPIHIDFAEETISSSEEPTRDWTGNGSVVNGVVTNKLVDGYLRVEVLDNIGNWVAVTDQWLNLGWARQQQIPDLEAHADGSGSLGNTINPKAILLLQQPKDTAPAPWSSDTKDWYPINIYDTREGNMRDVNDGSCNVGGVINLVEIDVKNLRDWLQAHPNVQSQNGGYLLYFSDRRGMLANPITGTKTGAYGFEDVINESDPSGTPNA